MAADTLKKAAATEGPGHEVSKFRSMVSHRVGDGLRSASRAVKHGRYAAEDALDEIEHTIKHRPFRAAGLAFGAGVLMGALVSWIGSRRR